MYGDVPSKDDASSLLRRCIGDVSSGIILSKHFREELRNEGLMMSDALYVLANGLIYEAPEQNIKTGEWKYRVEGSIPEGVYLAIVFCFKSQNQALLITTFSIKGLSR